MPLDLKRISAGQGDKLIDPRDIFNALPNKPWPRLRLEQGEVLKAWFDRRPERDLVIKQNTGGGKTAVGLLAAQSSLNEGVGPAAYLVPDTYLVQQVLDEAARLGLATTTDPRSAEYRSGAAILVATFHKVVNGRSSFGLVGQARSIPLNTVVVDDAHAALAAATHQFTATIPAGHVAYTRLLALFRDDLTAQNYRNAMALLEGDRSTPMRIPFWAWSMRHQEVTDILRQYGDDDSLLSLFFPWPLIADHVRLAMATISHRNIEIRTPCPPIDMIPAFAQARRRIYLTATLADDGILVTELGADPASVRRPITPGRAADLGDRLILAPLALNPSLHEDAVRELARSFADGDPDGDGRAEAEPVNVVVLVPSDRAAGAWSSYADHTLHVTDMKPVIDRLVAGEHVGVVVLVNKYDGVDLPKSACELLVIDGVPTPLDTYEQREAGALAGSRTYRARTVQRLEQGMGRGIRDAEDHCAVLLLGHDLALSLVDPADRDLFSPATRAQIDLSQEIAEQITGEGLDAVRQALQVFLGRDAEWKALSSRATASVEYDRDGHVSAVAVARRKAWDLAAAGDPAGAFTLLRNAVDGVDAVERGWRLEEVAAYQHEISPDGAQATLRAARGMNRSVLMPAAPLQPKAVKGPAAQGEMASAFLTEQFENATALQLSVGATLNDIAWDPDRTEAAEEGFRRLGELLGFVSTRPEKEFGTGPDNHWAMSPTTHAVIELKTGVTRPDPELIKDEVNQLSGSLNWDIEHNPDATVRVPVLVHPGVHEHREASPPPNTRVITPEDLDRLKGSVRAFAQEISLEQGWARPATVTAALTKHNLIGSTIIQRHSRPPEPPLLKDSIRELTPGTESGQQASQLIEAANSSGSSRPSAVRGRADPTTTAWPPSGSHPSSSGGADG
ncbi:Replicative superfamily II helicase [Geodermatophilus africanus]|uniref:Replicative superfamily II helicase n=1 Tax=Geodermatophilus africanus TaxID=1137993 RepID=A0A1H3LER8_9ACTN|nr:DEAD/DEAH box helicase [Geodermatophilus africanus]SDY62790.1 Replicative superfamily II helicase [Geodermatophilus africanus]